MSRGPAEDIVYLDNAATSYPKPRAVLDAMVETYGSLGVSPGRGGYDLAQEASRYVDDTRRQLTGLFDAPDSERVVFAANATDALNLAIQGSLRPGDHVVSTRLEHNSVLRPLTHLSQSIGLKVDLVPFGADGVVDPEDVARAVRPATRLVIVTHASQVLGTVQPIAQIAAVCAERGVSLLVDAAQTAGLAPVTLNAWQAAAVAFTGHKALLGPAGIGGLVVSPEAEIMPTRFGGTGVDSESLLHTAAYPYRLEAGTLNLLGIIGLSQGVAMLQSEGIGAVHDRELALARRLQEGLASLPGVRVLSPPLRSEDMPVVTCTVEQISPSDVAAILDADHGIAVRSGLHCAPLVHRDLHTMEQGGAVRFSAGYFTTEEHIQAALEAMTAIANA